jgi:glycosyltransferase involved in cell wall biosynthesis
MISESSPFFSVIIPSYNRGSFISSTINSVLSQSFTSFEVVIVDDGSTDNTSEIVGKIKDPRVRYFLIKNSERGAARNFGVSMSAGKYITFLDSDDLFKSDHLSLAQQCLSVNPNWEVFQLGYDVVTVQGKIISRWKKLPSPVNKKLAEGNFLSCLGVFLKREIIANHRFDENRELSGSEDYELWLRIAAHYPIFTYPVSSACLVQHDLRSVLGFSAPRLVRRIELLQSTIQQNVNVVQYYGSLVRVIISYLDLYLSLHLVLSSNKYEGLKKLWRAFKRHPAVIFNYRFWVVVKKIV